MADTASGSERAARGSRNYLFPVAAALVLLLISIPVALQWSRAEGTPMTIEPGVPRALADDRLTRIANLEYELALRVPAAPAQPVAGRIVVRFTLSDASRPLVFDFARPTERLLSVAVASIDAPIYTSARPDEAAVQLTSDHVVLTPSVLTTGQNAVTFDFTTTGEALNRTAEFMYSLFVPARASHTFPCFDQPSAKARWSLTLDVPSGWEPVANGEEIDRLRTGDRTLVRFATTERLPSYLVAFAAGEFQIAEGERDGRRFRVFHRETDRAKLARNLDPILDAHAQALAWLSDYTGVPYRFGKFDIVLIPAFQFTGMEHPGAVYYSASALLLEATATRNQQLVRANVIAHETAHMWFGNLVTMSWFDDVWMKEVFANFFAARIVNPSFPTMNHELRFLLQHYPAAYDVDRTDGANPIRQPLANLSDAASLYGAIIYQKAPIVMRQLEELVGAGVFRDAVRDYVRTYAFAHAGWPDFVAILDRLSPVDVASWSHAWVSEAGRPTLTTVLDSHDGVITRLAFRHRDPRNRGLTWPQRLRIRMGRAGGESRQFDVLVNGPETVVREAAGLPVPDWVLPDDDGVAYGLVELDERTLGFLRRQLHTLERPMSRGVALVSLWELMLEGALPPAELLEELQRALPLEQDELVLQHMLDAARTLFWRFTPAEARPAAAAALEPILRTGLERATTTSTRTAWFNALRSTALTGPTIEWLTAVWRRSAPIPGLPLAETDEADLALDLAVRDVPDAANILREQLSRFANLDRRERFAFILPAVSADDAERARFFEGLRDANRRKREAWVIDAMRYLHHPLRSAASGRLVVPALELTREIQQTGDIFFPKRWADAVLSGYQSPEMAARVRHTIDALPADYPERLRWALLASADPLLRAARLLAPK